MYLQHYIEFDIHTIIMLEKLFGAKSFGGSINHLLRHEAIIFASSNKFGFPSIIRTTTPAFSRCWALITFALVIRFQ